MDETNEAVGVLVSGQRMVLRIEEVAEILGVSRSLVYMLVGRGDMPSIQIGRCRRVPVDELRVWLRRQSSR